MPRGRFHIRLIALAAAYALALQGIFTAFVPVPALAATAPTAILCMSFGIDADGGAPGDGMPHQRDCPACVLLGCGGGLALTGQEAAERAAMWHRVTGLSGGTEVGSRPTEGRQPQNPRAPPLSA